MDVPAMTETSAQVEQLIDVGSIADFAVGKFRLFQIDGIEVGVLRTSSGKWYGMRNLCPHRLAPLCAGQVSGTMLPCDKEDELEYGMEDRILRCPWHGYEFDLETGRALFGAHVGRAQVYGVVTKDGRVYVRSRRLVRA
jgi:nitrite reductase (NADH) small subunit